MKAYLASSYSRRHEMQGRRTQLHDEGIVVTSRWLDDEDPWDPADHARGYRLFAARGRRFQFRTSGRPMWWSASPGSP